MAQEINQNDFEIFLQDKCQPAPGYMIKLGDLYDKFQETLPALERRNWSKPRMGKSLPSHCIKGRIRQTGQFHIGNIAWQKIEVEERPRLVNVAGFLEPCE